MLSREQAFKQAFEVKEKDLNLKRAARSKALLKLEQENSELKAAEQKLSAVGAQIALLSLSGDTAALNKIKAEAKALSSKKQDILTAAGIPPIEVKCEKCGDTGYVDGKICDCIKNLAKLLIIEDMASEVPLKSSRFEDFSLDFYPDEKEGQFPKKKMTELFKFTKEYAISFNPKTSESLLFMGVTGLGKTHLSLSIVYELLNKGFDVVYGSAYNLFADMENEHFNLRSDASYKKAVGCDLLVIDDLGGEFVSPYIQSLFYNIVNTRLLSARPTIINTNLSMPEIENRYTPRVSSRLMGSYKAKLFLGNDIRQIKRLTNTKP